jgi:phosphomannomutase
MTNFQAMDLNKNTKHTVEIAALMQSSGVSFGTSGVRGLVSAMPDTLCFAYTLSFLQTLNIAPGSTVAVAMDLRPSSPTIAAACCAAIEYAGMNVDFCGAIPTPALAFYAEQKSMAGIMITGSHIPFDRNGIKFYSPVGEITKQHEAAISQARVQLPEATHTQTLPEVNPAARNFYIQRYIDYFEADCLKGLTLAFYQHSSVARDLLTDLLTILGAKVVPLGRTDEFVPIDTEAVAKVDVERAQSWAKEIAFDAIISTDGDADRPLIGDENGHWMRGDVVGLLTAQFLGAKAIATPVSCNTAIESSGYFSNVVRTRIGSPYVIEAMEVMLSKAQANVVGFEANGGFLLGSAIKSARGELAPLCTRDAVLPILAVIAFAKQKGCKLSQLTKALPPRFTASDRIQAFPTETSRALLQNLASSDDKIKVLLGGLVGNKVKLDQTDGLRITFESGEIVHLRPSGNAPELRCYVEADTQARADNLVPQVLHLVKESQHNASALS